MAASLNVGRICVIGLPGRIRSACWTRSTRCWPNRCGHPAPWWGAGPAHPSRRQHPRDRAVGRHMGAGQVRPVRHGAGRRVARPAGRGGDHRVVQCDPGILVTHQTRGRNGRASSWIAWTASRLRVSVTDEGVGFDPAEFQDAQHRQSFRFVFRPVQHPRAAGTAGRTAPDRGPTRAGHMHRPDRAGGGHRANLIRLQDPRLRKGPLSNGSKPLSKAVNCPVRGVVVAMSGDDTAAAAIRRTRPSQSWRLCVHSLGIGWHRAVCYAMGAEAAAEDSLAKEEPADVRAQVALGRVSGQGAAQSRGSRRIAGRCGPPLTRAQSTGLAS